MHLWQRKLKITRSIFYEHLETKFLSEHLGFHETQIVDAVQVNARLAVTSNKIPTCGIKFKENIRSRCFIGLQRKSLFFAEVTKNKIFTQIF